MSKMHPFAMERKRNIQKALALIKDNQPVKNEVLLAYVGIETGVTEGKALEYLKVLQDGGFIAFDGSSNCWSVIEK